jgi:hypothetical protein
MDLAGKLMVIGGVLLLALAVLSVYGFWRMRHNEKWGDTAFTGMGEAEITAGFDAVLENGVNELGRVHGRHRGDTGSASAKARIAALGRRVSDSRDPAQPSADGSHRALRSEETALEPVSDALQPIPPYRVRDNFGTVIDVPVGYGTEEFDAYADEIDDGGADTGTFAAITEYAGTDGNHSLEDTMTRVMADHAEHARKSLTYPVISEDLIDMQTPDPYEVTAEAEAEASSGDHTYFTDTDLMALYDLLGEDSSVAIARDERLDRTYSALDEMAREMYDVLAGERAVIDPWERDAEGRPVHPEADWDYLAQVVTAADVR